MSSISRAPIRRQNPNQVITYVSSQINGKSVAQLGDTLRQLRMTPYELISLCQQARTQEALQIRRAVMKGIADGELDPLEITENIVIDLSAQVKALNKQWMDLRINLQFSQAAPDSVAEIADEIEGFVKQLQAQNQDLVKRVSSLSTAQSTATNFETQLQEAQNTMQALCGALEIAVETAPKDIVQAVSNLKTTLEQMETQNQDFYNEAAKVSGLESQVATLTSEKASAEAARDKAQVVNKGLQSELTEAQNFLLEQVEEINQLKTRVAQLRQGASRFARVRYRLACWINSLSDPCRHLRAFINELPEGDFKNNISFQAKNYPEDVRREFDKTNLKRIVGDNKKLGRLCEKAYYETLRRIRLSTFDQFILWIKTSFAQAAIFLFPSIINLSTTPPGSPAVGELDEDAPTQEIEVDLEPEKIVHSSVGGNDGMHITADKKTAIITITGNVRGHNEDGFLHIIAIDKTSGDVIAELFIVADGMGGQGDGEGQEASKVAIETIRDNWDATNPDSVLIGIQKAVKELCYRSHLTQVHAGTCMTIMHKTRNKAYVWNLGDTRLMFKRGNDVQQITLDNSLAAEFFATDKNNQFSVPLRGSEVKAFWDFTDDCQYNNVVRNGIVAKPGGRTFVGYLEKTWFGKNQDQIWKALIDSQCIEDDKSCISGRSKVDIRFNERRDQFVAAMGVSLSEKFVARVFDILQKSTRNEIDTQTGDTFYLFSDGLSSLTKRAIEKSEIEGVFGNDTSWQAFYRDAGQKQYCISHMDGAAIDENLIRSKIPADKVDAFLALWQPHALTNFDKFVEIVTSTTQDGKPLRADKTAEHLISLARKHSRDNSTVVVVEA
jgi:serine/threonine protein phosphatase PrpC